MTTFPSLISGEILSGEQGKTVAKDLMARALAAAAFNQTLWCDESVSGASSYTTEATFSIMGIPFLLTGWTVQLGLNVSGSDPKFRIRIGSTDGNEVTSTGYQRSSITLTDEPGAAMIRWRG